MILSKIYNKLDKDKKEDLVFGLFGGLIYGLIYGLFFGLVGGLIYGLFGGLFGGLVGGLVGGLFFGLFGGLVGGLVVILTNFTEALPFIQGALPIIFLIFGLFLLIEILFWLSPKEKVKKKNVVKHTLLRKGEALLETLMIFSAITQIYVFTRDIDFVKYSPEILTRIGYIGAGAIGLGLLILIGYAFIKLNSLKYR